MVVGRREERQDPHAVSCVDDGSGGRALTLLYVEDHLVSVSVMRAVLELAPSWRMLHAGLVESGIAAARAHRPDLVLLDMHLPDGSGGAVLTALKADPETSAIPVVVLTAGGLDTDAALLLEAGADEFWTKPHDLDLMLDYFESTRTRALAGQRR